MKKVLLIIRDGWGLATDSKTNAITVANTPNNDEYLKKYPNTLLDASGLPVGVPKGYQGSSEVGHLNMGAARIVKQEIVRIDEFIEDGSLFENENLKRAYDNAKGEGKALHLMGLVQPEGVHAHQEHLFAMLKHAAKEKISKVYVHFFGDGRDTPPRSALTYLAQLEEKIKEYGVGEIATVVGRYYAMDRGQKWDMTDIAYNLLVKAEGTRFATAKEAIQDGYDNDKLPDGGPMSDEYLKPSVIGDFTGIKDGDSVVHFNYRQDRAIQLTYAFVEDDYKGKRDRKLDIVYCGLTRYYDAFKYNVLKPLDEGKDMANLVGEVISKKGLKQLRIAETQKFKHVTSFFNGKMVDPYEGEDRIEVEGRFDPAMFGDHPEMEAYIVKDKVIEQIKTNKYDLIVLNYANCDMVGHTGIMESAVKAVEAVDECVGETVKAGLENGYAVLVTADHGNAEEMLDPDTGKARTSHTVNPVELIYIADDAENVKLVERGCLADIGATILDLLDIEKPEEASATSLIKK